MKTEMARQQMVKYAVLVVLVLQNSALALCMRYSRMQGGGGATYAASTAVVAAEMLKIVASMMLQAKEDGGVTGLVNRLRTDIFAKPMEMVKMSVPAILYCLQNNLAYIAISNLDGPTFQLLYQLKILTTAMFSVILLKRTLSGGQWSSLLILAMGVGLVQISSSSGSSSTAKDGGMQMIGFAAVLCACLTSGMAGVYFEKILKQSKVSIWIRNIQLASYGIVAGAAAVYYGPDAASVADNGFFFGYTPIVWGAVALNSLGGLVVAMVVKHADNVVKGFATSISILITSLVSIYAFGFVVNGGFVLGAAMVLFATYLYGKPQQNKAVRAQYEDVKKGGASGEDQIELLPK
jgi:UDP-sugar transporter A1/2/3